MLALNNNNSAIVFYIIPSFTHSSLVLNLSEFLSSAEHKLYFKEGGKPKFVSAVYFPFRPNESIHKSCCVLAVLAHKITWFSYQALLDSLFRARASGARAQKRRTSDHQLNI